jgi:hypothetical protein
LIASLRAEREAAARGVTAGADASDPAAQARALFDDRRA